MGSTRQDADTTIYEVVVNTQMQYAIWPTARRLPVGWRYVGKAGPKTEMLAYLHAMLVETLPTPLRMGDRGSPESGWAN